MVPLPIFGMRQTQSLLWLPSTTTRRSFSLRDLHRPQALGLMHSTTTSKRLQMPDETDGNLYYYLTMISSAAVVLEARRSQLQSRTLSRLYGPKGTHFRRATGKTHLP